MDAKTFRSTVIVPTLQQIGLYSEAAADLLLGTALQESNLIHRRQIGGGPGRGYYQMEPATHDDIWKNYLAYRKKLAATIGGLVAAGGDRLRALETNDTYATGMARVHYMRVPAPLPSSGDVKAMANYWKLHYNTVLGVGTAKQFVDNWNRVMGSKK